MGKEAKILITGSNGFIGKNLIDYFEKKYKDFILLKFDISNTLFDLDKYCEEADFIFHFASIQRPKIGEDYASNLSITDSLIKILEKKNRLIPIFFSSSIHVDSNTEYGRIKKMEEELILAYAKRNNTKCYIWRFNNLFGKYSKPNYTSVISTFCYNAIKNIPIQINDVSSRVCFSYVCDAIEEFVSSIILETGYNQINYLSNKYTVSLGELAYYLSAIKNNEKNYILNENKYFFEKLSEVYEWFIKEYKC